MDGGFSRLRVEAGLTLEEAADLIGCDIRTVYRYEGGRNPKKAVIRLLEKTAAERADARKIEPTFTFIDLFAGIGGMRLAFEAAGGRCVATCENNKYARETYAANFAVEQDTFFNDIRDITKDDRLIRNIPDHDVLVAGFPCQPFSIAGVSKKNALGNPHGFACNAQGTLFFDLARIIKLKKPKAFLLENVKNLVNHDRGNTLRVIMSTLRHELKYEFVDHRVIDAKAFVPQHRERTIIVGFRKDAGFSWDDVELPPKDMGPRMSTVLHTSSEVADGRYVLANPTRVNPKYTLTDHLWKYLRNYAAKHRAAGNGFGYGMVGPGDVARTLSARYYKDGSEILVERGKRRNPRRLTPRECARLMGFDRKDREPFKIVVSDTQAYKQFGNAVAVPVIEAVACAMRPCILDLKAGLTEPRLPLSRAAVAAE
jgi:DNA (cytosine-5)-methyltransferase 1